jgi:hypothetical protein
MFNHKEAQEYEMESHVHWISSGKTYEDILLDEKRLREGEIIEPHYLDQFFKGDVKVWRAFVDKVSNSNCMEIAGGICGIMPLWGHWIKGRKISIDPLIKRCDNYLRSKGESWFQGIELVDKGAEEFIPEYKQLIDGFILWRNGMDHMEEPEKGMEVVSSYAKSGCLLLFWTDVKHKDTPDMGHKNIGEKPEDVEELIKTNGWSILYRTPNIHESIGMIEYGCVAIKQ